MVNDVRALFWLAHCAAAVVASIFMAVVKFTWKRGFSASKMGFEYPLSQLAVGIALGLIGPGSYALDAFFRLPFLGTAVFCVLALCGIVVDLLGMFLSRPVPSIVSQEGATWWREEEMFLFNCD